MTRRNLSRKMNLRIFKAQESRMTRLRSDILIKIKKNIFFIRTISQELKGVRV